MDDMNGGSNSEGVVAQALVAMCQFGCANCHTVVVARIPAMRVYNFPETSGVVVGHERLAKCAKCQTMYVPLIKAVDNEGKIQWVWRPVPQSGEQQVHSEATPVTKAELDRPIKTRKQ